MKKDTILVIGACGQIGTELTAALRLQHGSENIIAADKIKAHPDCIELDVLDTEKLKNVVKEFGVTQIYLLAAMLSATGEKNIDAAWKLNMQSLLSVLEIAREQQLDKVFWPSSIAIFGPGAPRHNCPQDTIIEPTTVYGISKRTGEYWCNYYFNNFGVDVRSLRYPGLISYTTPPGGGSEAIVRASRAGSPARRTAAPGRRATGCPGAGARRRARGSRRNRTRRPRATCRPRRRSR